MYLEFFGLKKRPFDMTPDPSFFFPSQKHKEALASLVYTLTAKRGFVVITGDIGSGKTTVCRTLLRSLDPAAKVALLTNTILTPKQLLEAVCDALFLPADNRTKVCILSRLHQFLIQQNEAGNPVVLIFDEAQNLSIKALEEIRLISNMETDTQKLVQIIFLGQPELRDKIGRPELEQLRQRISLRYHLRSLDRKEIRPYIEHRLRIAGDEEGRVKFTRSALDSVYKFSKGVPRLINVVCDQALLTAYLRDSRKIDQTIVAEIIAEFDNSPVETFSLETEQQPDASSGFRRLFRRGRTRRARQPMTREQTFPSEAIERPGPEDEKDSPLDEPEIVGRLSELKLAQISPENGSFVATVDGVHLRADDRLFGMTVARIEAHGIVFISGEKSYQLAIERPGGEEEK